MRQRRPCLNEAEIRAKVVDVWLRDHGFTLDQILVEKTFKIRLGRGIRLVGADGSPGASEGRPRSDYLVRGCDGRNLFVIEAKAAGESIDNESRKQAISYARLLDDGGIAPFVIVTNGHETEVIDSISEAAIGGQQIPLNHPYVTAGFRVSLDDLACRTEALEYLISVSSDNLLAFCDAQVKTRMARLRSDDLNSGFKYVPRLYIEREKERKRLQQLIEAGKKCVLVLGRPQVGKTNFMCHFVEEQLSLGRPCLFYAAVGVESGLLDAIREDFEWTFGDSSSAFQVIRRKLGRVLDRSAKRLLIVVEGLNENQELIKAFASESERLQSENVCLIPSFTTYSADKILLDPAGNPTYSAIATGVQKRDVPVMKVDASNLPSNLSAVYLDDFSSDEVKHAYRVYLKAFQVTEPEKHRRTSEPLLLRNAMECFRGSDLPAILDAVEILSKTIHEKLSRVTDVSEAAGRAILEEIARRSCEGQPMTEFWLHQQASSIEGLFEAALLVRRGSETTPRSVDFYVSSERAFVISHWIRNWPVVLRGRVGDMSGELMFVANSDIASDALRWFIRQRANRDILSELAETIQQFEDAACRRVIVLCLCDYLIYPKDEDDELDDEKHESLSDLMDEIANEARTGESEVRKILVDAVSDANEDLGIRQTCAIGLGTFDPEGCLKTLAAAAAQIPRRSHEIVSRALEPGFKKAVDEICEIYYGSFCKGYLYSFEGDTKGSLAEYDRLIRHWRPAIQMFRFSQSSDELEAILLELNPGHQKITDLSRQESLFE